MSTDPYKILGVEKTASQDDIRKAYRSLAKKYHPDLNPGNKNAEEQFKLIGVANDLLSDPEKRVRFDRGEINMHGQEQGFSGNGYRHYADGNQGFRYNQQGGANFSQEDIDFNDIFSMFGGGARRSQQNRPTPGQDVQYNLTIDFMTVMNGGKQRVTLPNGDSLDVRIPVGIEDGQVLRLRGKGMPSMNGGNAGDALVKINIASHPHFKRDGRNIRLTWPIDLKTAVLGGKITVPTPQGDVALNVPPHSDTGNTLRLRGRGFPPRGDKEAGDLYVTFNIKLGIVDPKLEEFLRNTSDSNA